MTDRELLELAARAAGYMPNKSWSWVSDSDGFMCRVEGRTQYWNPLHDPGDALRLAVALHLCIKHFPIVDTEFGPSMGMVEVYHHDDNDPLYVEYLRNGDDRLIATMRAITQATAEIGRTKL